MLDSGMSLHEAFALLEEQDYERVPVVEDGKLVGVLSRSGVQRRGASRTPTSCVHVSRKLPRRVTRMTYALALA